MFSRASKGIDRRLVIYVVMMKLWTDEDDEVSNYIYKGLFSDTENTKLGNVKDDVKKVKNSFLRYVKLTLVLTMEEHRAVLIYLFEIYFFEFEKKVDGLDVIPNDKKKNSRLKQHSITS